MTLKEELQITLDRIKKEAVEGYIKTAVILVLENTILRIEEHKGETL
jgi:hypothetical protein